MPSKLSLRTTGSLPSVPLTMQEKGQRAREGPDVWESVLHFVLERDFGYLPLHSGLYLFCISAL